MKIKTFFFGIPEYFRIEFPEAFKAFETFGSLRDAYIELDTGTQFDQLPEEFKVDFKKEIESFLYFFGRMLLLGEYLDLLLAKQGADIRPGLQAIRAGLSEMAKQFEQVKKVMEKVMEADSE